MKRHTYSQIPLPESELGRECYDRGFALATEEELALDHIVWDCDELLWDWALSMRSELRQVRRLMRGDLTHREFLRTKPGVWELIWGLHHGTLASGIGDGFIRISTNGYAWRLFKIASQIPGMGDLVGSPASVTEYEGWLDHPRVFTRPNYADVAWSLRVDGDLDALESVESPAREVIRRHMLQTPLDSTLKLPELAQLAGKEGFADARILVDDSLKNVERFAATGRVGVHADVPAKRRFRGTKMKYPPNSIWKDHDAYLDSNCTELGLQLADAFSKAHVASAGAVVTAIAPDRADVQRHGAPISFTLDVPGDCIGSEWVEPMRALKRKLGQLAETT